MEIVQEWIGDCPLITLQPTCASQKMGQVFAYKLVKLPENVKILNFKIRMDIYVSILF